MFSRVLRIVSLKRISGRILYLGMLDPPFGGSFSIYIIDFPFLPLHLPSIRKQVQWVYFWFSEAQTNLSRVLPGTGGRTGQVFFLQMHKIWMHKWKKALSKRGKMIQLPIPLWLFLLNVWLLMAKRQCFHCLVAYHCEIIWWRWRHNIFVNRRDTYLQLQYMRNEQNASTYYMMSLLWFPAGDGDN